MSDFKIEVDYSEWSALVRRAGWLDGLIQAHEIAGRSDARAHDEVMWALAKEGADARVEG